MSVITILPPVKQRGSALRFGLGRRTLFIAIFLVDDEGSGKKNDENEDDFDTLLQKAMRR